MTCLRNVALPAIARVVAIAPPFAAFAGLPTAGCEPYHNEAERLAYKRSLDAQEKRLFPDAGAAEASGSTYIGAGYNPPDPTQCPNNNTCLPDPGSAAIAAEECKAAELGLEFFPVPIWDFEDSRESQGYNDKNRDRLRDSDEVIVEVERFAKYGYTYGDDTTLNFYPRGWEPPAIADPYHRCERSDSYVYHMAGGPFLEWGGGIGRSLRCMNTSAWSADSPAQRVINAYRDAAGYGADEKDFIYCRSSDTAACAASAGDPIGEICPKRDQIYRQTGRVDPPEDTALIGLAVDLSKWEGISFWARRGPNSQPGIRISVGDKYTDDDVSLMQYLVNPHAPRYCERAVECKCKSASRPCTTVTREQAKRINDQSCNSHDDAIQDGKCKPYETDGRNQPTPYELNPIQEGDSICWEGGGGDAETDIKAAATTMQYCGESACHHQSDSSRSLNIGRDPFIDTTTCQEFSFRGSITSNFCYNPSSQIVGQRKPAEGSELCGDHWMKSLPLSLDWQFYTVPFAELLQQGWAKRSYELDLTSLSLVRFTWDRGYIDYYIDDVRFYRRK